MRLPAMTQESKIALRQGSHQLEANYPVGVPLIPLEAIWTRRGNIVGMALQKLYVLSQKIGTARIVGSSPKEVGIPRLVKNKSEIFRCPDVKRLTKIAHSRIL